MRLHHTGQPGRGATWTRRLAVAAVTGVAAVALTACSTTGPGSAKAQNAAKVDSGHPFKLGVSLTFNNTDFWTSYISYEKKFAAQYHAQLIGPLIANNDSGKQITDIHTLISQGAQAIIVNPVDSAAIAPALQYAQSKGVPVVSVDVAPTSGKVYMIVRADNQLYGKEACQYIGSKVKTGTVAQLQGDLSSLNGRDRSTAFSACMKQNFPNLKVVNYPTKWDTPTATNDVQNAMSSHQDLKAIYVQWSGPVPGIIQAEKSAHKFAKVGQPGHIVLVSDDGVPFEMKDIREGLLDATVSQPANEYAQYAIKYARDALAGKHYQAGDSTGHSSGTFVSVFGNIEDPIKAPLVTAKNVSDSSLWGNQAG